MSVEAPYGEWESPLSAADIAAGTLRLNDVAVDGEAVYWVEGRPAEEGRSVIVRYCDGVRSDVIAAPFSARTAVHEYGGGSLTVHDGVVYFSDARHGDIYRVTPGEEPELLREGGTLRFADFEVDGARRRLLAVCEDHRQTPVQNSLVAISLEDGAVTTLAAGADFYSSPRLSPDGRSLAWITWDFPQMPWDGTLLHLADAGPDGGLLAERVIAGSEAESVMQPRWSPAGVLHCVTDRTGWWNIHRVDAAGLVNVAPLERECARPHWNFGLSTYAFLGETRIAFCSAADGFWQLRILDTASGAIRRADVPWTEMGARVHAVGERLLVDGGSPLQPLGLHLVDTSDGSAETIWRAAVSPLDPAWVSASAPISFAAPDGATAHALLYTPVNPDYSAPPGTKPPLLVLAHGGPTAAARSSLQLEIQYFTTRGFTVCDVNYGGSTGYGRAYRERLRGLTGCVDVDDCIAAAKHLATTGICDAEKMCISGGSAGGYIVLCALVFEPGVFAAATSYYGVTDIEAITTDDHKFESRYYDSLIGPPETHRSLYHNRSPIHFVSRIITPLLVLQGEDDTIVPLSQAEAIIESLRESDIPHAYIAFPGEQHGFRKASTIVAALEAELGFYGQVLGFTPAGSVRTFALSGGGREPI